jgi:two-component system, cell cycle sensor histidine kinase and response regulator CckA
MPVIIHSENCHTFNYQSVAAGSKVFERIKRNIITMLLFLVCICASNAYAEEKKHVLILNSYHQGYKWTDEITQGIVDSMSFKRKDLKFYIEYMGTKWVFDQIYFEKLYDIYKTKYSGIKFDAIVASDNDAFDFLRKYRNQTFGDVPVVFCGVNWLDPTVLKGQSNFTGVNEDADIATNLDLMIKLHPQVKHLYVVVDRTTTGNISLQKINQLIPQYPRLQFHILYDLEIAQLLSKVSNLSDDSLVLLTVFQKDRSGLFLESSDLAQMLSESSRVPVYALWDFNLGFGVLGGMMTSGQAQGENAGALALRVLQGETADSIPIIMESPNRYRFDYKVLQRFGIRQEQLPKNSNVINEPPSFYAVNKGLVWGLSAGTAMLAITIIILMINTHRRNLAEEAFHKSEERYSTLVDNLSLGIFRNDGLPGGRFIQVNPAMVKMFGYESMPEFLSVPVDNLYSNPLERIAVLKEVADKGYIKDKVILMKKRDGETIWVSVNSNAKYDSTGRLIWIDGVFEDINSKKLLEMQLQQSQKMEAIGTLAGGVAHDFNNILTAIIGYGNLLKVKAKSNEALMPYVTPILSAAEKASQLTKSLLAFSRKQPISLKKINVNDVVDGMAQILQRVIGDDIELVLRKDDSRLLVDADAGQLEQVLLNLVTNARDAMPKGGVITVETSRMAVSKRLLIKHVVLSPGEYVVVSVSDSGVGMPEETQQRIFEPFFSTKELGKGTGLGLSIVYGIIKQHKGDIGVYSEVGRGTTFKIYLPQAVGEEDKVSEEPPAPVAGGSEKILVADDDDQVRNLVVEVLKDAGYQIIAARDGVEAVEKFKENQDSIDMLLLDVVMARKNGKEAYEDICKIRPDIKVLFISGYTADIIHQKGVLEKHLEFLSKPLSPDILLGKVRQVLAKS